MTPRITALILCGGSGTRLGGIDKPLREFCGRPLIERTLQGLLPHADEIVISANRNLDRYALLAKTVADEAQFRACGPLAGLLAGLEAAACEDVLCVPGDAPLLPENLLSKLFDARADAPGSTLAYAHDGHGPQPLCCVLSRRLRTDLRAYLIDGGRTPREWFLRQQTAIADFSDSPTWAWSLNTPEEWTMAERHFRKRTSS